MKKITQAMRNFYSKSRTNRVLTAALCLFIYTSAVLFACIFSAGFADFYDKYVSANLRRLLSVVTGYIPFSVSEIGVLLIPLLIIAGACFVIKGIINKDFSIIILLKRISAAVIFVFFVFVNVFGVCYFKTPLESNLGLERQKLSRKEVYEDAVYTKQMLTSSADNVEFDETGASVNPHTFFETCKLVDKGYSVLDKENVYKSFMVGKAKPIMLSSLMTYTHISGIYMPFTGEANVNTNYPDYVVAFTIAHEKAHQRGIAGEDEANFMAFLSCMASGDDYLKYCALMNMYDYYLDETLKQDEEMYIYLVDNTDKRIVREMYAYYKFFEKYAHSTVSEIADTVNDTYIKTMGNEDGVKSYGLVIELYHSYIQKENK